MLKCAGFYGTPEKIAADVHVLFFIEDDDHFRRAADRLPARIRDICTTLKARKDFTGAEKQIVPIVTASDTFVLAGLGTPASLTLESLRRAAGRAMKRIRKQVADSVAFHGIQEDLVRKLFRCSMDDMLVAIVEGAMLAHYRFERYHAKKDTDVHGQIRELKIVIADEGFQGRLKSAIETATIIVDGVELARSMTNMPANEMSAEAFARDASAIATKHGMKFTALGRKEIEVHKMAGLLAVNQGSRREPRFVVMEYNESKRKFPTYVLVGKGVTFDSGGLSIKPAASMEDMKTDMAGAAAVLATMQIAARFKLPLRLIGLMPLTDNAIGGNALCPGDVIRYSNGRTVEVLNTDAEGRLILADALIYAQRYKPLAIIDLATLTGAIMVALGTAATGMMGTDEQTKSALRSAGIKTHERVWEMPLYDEYDTLIKGTITDLKNIGGRWAGAVTAGAFLKSFVGDTPWVHLDIAGTSTTEEELPYCPKGATGVGVRLLTEFLRTIRQ